MGTKYEYGVKANGEVTPWPTREIAEENLARRVEWKMKWHPGAGYGKHDYDDPGVLVERTITTSPWVEISGD